MVAGDAPRQRGGPGCLWFIVPMVLSALLIGAVAVAVRSGDDDEATAISGPATQLPSVTAAAGDLLGSVPPAASIGADLGQRYGEVVIALEGLTDDVDFAGRFDRLPDAEAKLLGRSLGEIQGELEPTALDGAREDADREGDIIFALDLAGAATVVMHPDGTAHDRAVGVLPFSVQDLPNFDAIADAFAAGDMTVVAPLVDEALSDAGASEIVSSVAFDISEHLAALDDDVYGTNFMAGYSAGSG